MSPQFSTPMARAISAAYDRGEEDETMEGLHLVNEKGDPVGLVEDGDYVIFYNIRGEREVQLSLSLTQADFEHFQTNGRTVNMATMIEYDPVITDHVAFPPAKEINNTLSEAVSNAGIKHAKIVESEKEIHVNCFMNGKREEPFPKEERIIIESNREVDDFDELPQMNVADVADAVIDKIGDPEYPLLCANFANMDVVGHIEDKPAVLDAIEAVDEQVGRVIRAAKSAGTTAVVTADHGTVEKWYYPEGAIDTGHTDSRVPFIVTDDGAKLRNAGDLTDVAPTVLQLLGITPPDEMTGKSLLEQMPQEDSRQVLLLIVDGWGLNEDPETNLITQADTPNMDWLLAEHNWLPVTASGPAVGMPEGTVGNSEAGHLHIGAGHTVRSDRMRIATAIEDGSFRDIPAFQWAIDGAMENDKKLHLLGIISFYSSHGSVEYLKELLRLCANKGAENVFMHGLLGRRGERPESGAAYVGDIEKLADRLGVGKFASVIGRHWALDREEHWDRVEMAYRLLTAGDGTPVRSE